MEGKIKVHVEQFLLPYSKDLSKINDEEWRLFYCADSTLGCRVIQDFDLCK